MAYNYEFRGADLSGTRVVDKDFSKSNFVNCCLKDVTFQDCDLRSAVFDNCDLDISLFDHCKFDENTKFINCDMHNSRIRYCNLTGVSFKGSRLDRILFICSSNPPLDMFPSVCPEHGSFTAYKALYVGTDLDSTSQCCIAELYIPAQARRLNYYGSRKCRSSVAKVVKFYDTFGNVLDIKTARSMHSFNNGRTVYSKGKYVYPDLFDEDRTEECSNGIHFFMTFKEAVDYANDNSVLSWLVSGGNIGSLYADLVPSAINIWDNTDVPFKPSFDIKDQITAGVRLLSDDQLDPNSVVKLKEENNGQS